MTLYWQTLSTRPKRTTASELPSPLKLQVNTAEEFITLLQSIAIYITGWLSQHPSKHIPVRVDAHFGQCCRTLFDKSTLLNVHCMVYVLSISDRFVELTRNDIPAHICFSTALLPPVAAMKNYFSLTKRLPIPTPQVSLGRGRNDIVTPHARRETSNSVLRKEQQ